jgi:hypothetical protein
MRERLTSHVELSGGFSKDRTIRDCGGNPKSETLNPKQAQMTEASMFETGRPLSRVLDFCHLKFGFV